MSNNSAFLGNVSSDYPDYLRDESRCLGRAESISFPTSEKEIVEHCIAARNSGKSITVQGARTGVTGAAVPWGGHILNMSKMNSFVDVRKDPTSDDFFLTVEPGVLFSEIQCALETGEFSWCEGQGGREVDNRQKLQKDFRAMGSYFFPPDITEDSASIGGMCACNASGAKSFFYGPTRKYIERVRIVLVDGDILELTRSKQKARERHFRVTTNSGRIIECELPTYTMPCVKNASGYFVQDNMDCIDLFIGGEGTLGIISEIEFRVIPVPVVRWVAVAFFPDQRSCVEFVKIIRTGAQPPVAIEFFDSNGLTLFRSHKKTNATFSEVPDIASEWQAALYLEFHEKSEKSAMSAMTRVSEIMKHCYADSEAIWLATNKRDIARLKRFRHAVPEVVNALIDERRKMDASITKLGTDMAVPDSKLDNVMALYHKGLTEAGLAFVLFGHIGDNHLHVNVFPNNRNEYARGKSLFAHWADEVVAMGGSISAEHGVGKLKAPLLSAMYGDIGINEMRNLKKLFDPEGMLNVGNLFGKPSNLPE